jgi:hypothetical protein
VKLKGPLILLIIVLSLIPLFLLQKYFKRVLQPTKSLSRFAGWLFLVLALVFIDTFLVVFFVKILFPGA